MTEGFRKDTITFEIVAYMGTISKYTDRNGNEWAKEVNIVAWNKGEPKVDIREWNSDHSRMSKGLRLTDEEAKALCDILKERYE